MLEEMMKQLESLCAIPIRYLTYGGKEEKYAVYYTYSIEDADFVNDTPTTNIIYGCVTLFAPDMLRKNGILVKKHMKDLGFENIKIQKEDYDDEQEVFMLPINIEIKEVINQWLQ